MKKIIFTLFLLLALTMPAVAQSQFWYRGFEFTYTGSYDTYGVALIGVSDECNSGRVVIPNTVTVLATEQSGGGVYENNLPVVAINAHAFDGCSAMTEVVVPDNVVSIGAGAFENCTALTSVALSRKLTKMGEGVFRGCTSLTDITWPHALASINNNTFYGCSSLRNITIPTTVKSIGESAFAYCTSLSSIVLPNSVGYMGWNVFYCCTGLRNVTLPRGITSLRGTFFGCTDLTTVNIPSSVTYLEGTFKGCTGLTALQIPRLVTNIGSETFADCSSLTQIDLPNSLTQIGSRAFSNTGLTSLELPSTVTRIESDAFYGCTQLASVTSRNLNPPYMVNSTGFSTETYGMAPLYVPASSVNKYQTANWWKLFENVEGKEVYNTTYDFVANGLYYIITANNTVTVKGGSEYDTDLTIPSTVINGGVTYTVTAVSPSAFSYKGLTSLNLPETLVTIGANAFEGNSDLTTLTIPVNVTSIGSNAFANLPNLTKIVWNARECTTSGIPYEVYGYGKNFYYGEEYLQYEYDEVKTNVTEIIIGNQVKVLPNGLAANSQITTIDLPVSLEKICEDAFYDCALLTGVTIPVNVTDIGEHAFCNCDGLAALTWNARSCPDYGGLYYQITYEYHTGYSDNTPDGSSPITQLTIGNEVEMLPDNFARSAYITSAELPASLKVIGDYAFYNCWNMTSDVILSDAVTEVGDHAFAGCAKVTRLSVGRNVKYIGYGAFGEGFEQNPNSYHYYDNYVPCMYLTSLTWNARQCESAGSLAYNMITELNIDDQVEVLPNGFARYANNLNSIQFPSSLRVIGASAFQGCSWLRALTLPTSVTTIGHDAFTECYNLVELNLPNSLDSIGSGAFSSCGQLVNLYIPASVTRIGQQTFKYCNSLATIVVDSANPVYDSRENCNAAIRTADNVLVITCKNTTIPSTITAIEDYAFYDNYQLTGMEIPNSVISIGKYAFAYCYNLLGMDIPNSVTTIGDHAFCGCSRLKSITLSESLEAIQPYTFASCDSLTSIRIPASVTSIDRTAFRYNPRLAQVEIDSDNPVYDSRDNCNAIIESETSNLMLGFNCSTIPNTLRSIGDSAFCGTRGPESLIIPNSVERIGKYAFGDCANIKTVKIGTGVKKIDDNAFQWCNNLTSVTIDNSADTIGEWAFYYCYNLKTLQLGNAVKMIDDYAFYDCSNLTSVVIPNSVKTIDRCAFYYCGRLTNLTIGNSVETIRDDAFYGCSSLGSVNCLAATPPAIEYYTFSSSTYNNATLYVPQASIEAYQAHQYWKKFQNIVGVAGAGPGDVDGNGIIAIADVTALIDVLLSGGDISIYGDVNGDGTVSIADVTALIDMLLTTQP